MKRRDDHHDYFERRMYMITIEVEGRYPLFDRLEGEAFNAGYSTIVILENGFTPFSKPSGERFYACAQGRLLMLSAWEHHNDKRLITANQCQQMNLMALTLCQHR